MSEVLLPPAAIGAVLLAAAGAAKLRAPGAAAQALGMLGLPAGHDAARAAGAVEVLVGAAALVLPGRLSFGLLALVYAVLAAAVVALRARGLSAADCGCFGEAGGGADRAHLLANLVFASLAGAAAGFSPEGVDPVALGPAGLALAAGVCCGALMVRAILTHLPTAWGAYGGRP